MGVSAPAKKSLYVSYINLADPFNDDSGVPAKYNLILKT
jgi:hypothetical protein